MRFRSEGLALFVSSLLLVPGLAAAQEWRGGKARVEGSVKNEKGEPIAGAKVSLRWGQSGHGGPDLQTDKKGKWAILGIVGGQWDVDFEAPGYLLKKISVSLSEAERNPPIDVQLEPQPQAQPHEETRVGGKTISMETSEAIERANAAFQEKKYTAAREDYLKALAELPDNEPLLMRIAAAYGGEGNTQDALKYARQAAQIDPGDANAWLLIATVELQDGNLKAGKAALDKVPAEKVTQPEVYMNIGILLYNKKKPAEAEIAFARALTMKPDLAEGYYYRGLVRLQQNHKQDAKADFQKYLELAPDGSESKDVKELLNATR